MSPLLHYRLVRPLPHCTTQLLQHCGAGRGEQMHCLRLMQALVAQSEPAVAHLAAAADGAADVPAGSEPSPPLAAAAADDEAAEEGCAGGSGSCSGAPQPSGQHAGGTGLESSGSGTPTQPTQAAAAASSDAEGSRGVPTAAATSAEAMQALMQQLQVGGGGGREGCLCCASIICLLGRLGWVAAHTAERALPSCLAAAQANIRGAAVLGRALIQGSRVGPTACSLLATLTAHSWPSHQI